MSCFRKDKPGNTGEAGSTLVTAATRNNMTLICVVLKAADGGQSVTDTISLMDYSYSNFTMTDISALQPELSGTVILPNGVDFSSLTAQENNSDEQTVTTLYYYQNHYLGTATKSAGTEKDSSGTSEPLPSESFSNNETVSDSGNETFSAASRILILILSLMIVAGLVAIVLGLRKNKKRKRR